MPGNSFVSEDRPGIFDRRAYVKILRFGVVGRNEKEAGWIFVVYSWRIHETARAGRLKRVRQLSDLERPKIIRQTDKIVFLQKANHFCLATFVRFQEGFLVGRDLRGAFWIGISEFWIREKCLQCAVTREFSASNHLHF